jgi:glycerol-3-phosphate acyltransferase PlsX
MVRFLMCRISAGGLGGWLGRLAGWVLKPWLRRLWEQLDPGRYNGATLVGVKGVVVKSHGSADAGQFVHAIRLALEEVHRDLPKVIERWLD